MYSEADSSNTIRLAIFASGSGSNAASIMDYFSDRSDVDIAFILTNKPNAGVIRRAYQRSIPVIVANKHRINDPDFMKMELCNAGVDYIILAGFLLLIPAFLLKTYPNRILNIHPALLPKYGGKGMYGMHVHEAVKAAGDTQSGPTVHFVNEQYDDGSIIEQEHVALNPYDTPEDIAAKVLALEHVMYPKVIDRLIFGKE